MNTSRAGLIGREPELERLDRALDAVREAPATIVIEGEAGIGKTALWEVALAAAAARGYRVLRTSGAQSEVQLLLGALSDLFDGVHDHVLPLLPPPQRSALSVALLLEGSERPPDPRLLDVAFLTALRELARTAPIVIAIDDVQWLDATTTGLLVYAFRRLRAESILLLLTQRSGVGAVGLLDSDTTGHAFDRIELGPLTPGALSVLLRDRLGTGLPRPVLLKVHETAAGNPFFAIELARAYARRGQLGAGEGLPVPESLRALVSERLANLPAPTREALLVVAAGGSHSEIPGAPSALDPALEAGIVAQIGDRVQFSHPLLAASLIEDAAPARLRDVHAGLATRATDPEQRARHLAASAVGPDESVAAALEDAAAHALARGARAAAAELLEQSASLTNTDNASALARREGGAGRLFSALGDGVRGGVLMRRAIDLLPEGHERALATWLLLDSTTRIDDPVALGEDALRQAGGDDQLRARVHSALSEVKLVRGEVRAAYAHASEARSLALRLDELSAVVAIARAANLETMLATGNPEVALRDAVALEATFDRAGTSPVTTPRNHLGRRRFWQDRLDEARALFEQLRQEAIDTYADESRPNVCLYLARIELRAGRSQLARAYAEEAFELAEHAGYTQVIGGALSVRALVDAWSGDVDAAREHLRESETFARSVDDRWHALHNRVTSGLLAASHADWAGVIASVGTLADELDEMGIAEPGIFPFEGDAIEAFVASGESEEAQRLIERCASWERPRTQAIAARGRGLLLDARGETDGAIAEFGAALGHHDRFVDPLERARTELAMGAALRRARHKLQAREAIETAFASFEVIGATAFAERARSELGRLSGRRTTDGLTATEERVATLVAQGLSNKQTAASLVVSAKTVEAHLTRIYAKLEVHSRAELMRRLAAPPQDVAPG